MRNQIQGQNKRQACFISLQKAFDILDHEILLINLETYGFWKTTLDKFRKYLSEQCQLVCENGSQYKKLCVKTGILHGCELGRSFFLLNIIDLKTLCRTAK